MDINSIIHKKGSAVPSIYCFRRRTKFREIVVKFYIYKDISTNKEYILRQVTKDPLNRLLYTSFYEITWENYGVKQLGETYPFDPETDYDLYNEDTWPLFRCYFGPFLRPTDLRHKTLYKNGGHFTVKCISPTTLKKKLDHDMPYIKSSVRRLKAQAALNDMMPFIRKYIEDELKKEVGFPCSVDMLGINLRKW